MVVMELLSCVFVYWYWGRWAYTTRLPPRYTAVQSSLVDKKEKGRIDLFAEMWLAAHSTQLGRHPIQSCVTLSRQFSYDVWQKLQRRLQFRRDQAQSQRP